MFRDAKGQYIIDKKDIFYFVLKFDLFIKKRTMRLSNDKLRIGEFNNAIECFKTVTELKPSIEEVWGLYTVTLLDIGDFTTAEAVIQKAYELNPTNEKIRFYQEFTTYL